MISEEKCFHSGVAGDACDFFFFFFFTSVLSGMGRARVEGWSAE